MTVEVVKIDEVSGALAVRCPKCGSAPGKLCELSSGGPRSNPHVEREQDAIATSQIAIPPLA